MSRNIDPTIIAYLKTRKPFSYAHLIKFERPIIAEQELDPEERQYVYLTDASVDQYFRDPRADPSPQNLGTKYIANKLLEVPAVQEYSEARATALAIKLDASSIGTTLADTVNVVPLSGDEVIVEFTFEIYNQGFVEGDKLLIDVSGTVYECDLLGFPEKTKMKLNAPGFPVGSNTLFIELGSKELISILQDKSSANYASFINREVYIYKKYFDENGVAIGEPYFLYKGIIQDASLEDNESTIIVEWTLNSHWGDFSEVRGRVASDESHRALDEHGVPQPEAAIKKVYAYDKGFIHADTAINLEATYTVKVEKQDVKYKKGFFGIGAKVKVKKYFVNEPRQTELDFQLQGKTLDVIYGVRPVEGFPVFADTQKDDSSQVYVAYALAEGELAGLYDLIINDKSVICNNLADFDARSTVTEENNVDVVCYGRADRGDVLEGVSSTNTALNDFYNTQEIVYSNVHSLTFLNNSYGFSQPLGTNTGLIGVQHENSIRINQPIDMTITFYAGRTNQAAAPNLVEIAQAQNFKVQADYWTGDDKMEYWGPNHRLLDTAYVVIHYTISEGETTIPTTKFVVKGSFIPCYNYDYSYQPYDKSTGENADNFQLGDVVTVKNSADDSVLDAALTITRKFHIRNSKGELEPRFEFSAQPSLGYNEGVPTIKKFYMEKGTDKWTMVTYNYEEHSGTVPVKIESTINSVVDNGGTVDYVLPPTNEISSSPYTFTGSGGGSERLGVRIQEY